MRALYAVAAGRPETCEARDFMPTPILRIPAHLFGRSVLVVEDEALIAWDLESTLNAAGLYVLGPVASVQAALALLRTSRPDAAILDVNLQGELVTPVARELRNMNVPFVLSTAYNNLRPVRGDALEGAPSIGKPLPARRFLDLLSEMLEHHA